MKRRAKIVKPIKGVMETEKKIGGFSRSAILIMCGRMAASSRDSLMRAIMMMAMEHKTEFTMKDCEWLAERTPFSVEDFTGMLAFNMV